MAGERGDAAALPRRAERRPPQLDAVVVAAAQQQLAVQRDAVDVVGVPLEATSLLPVVRPDLDHRPAAVREVEGVLVGHGAVDALVEADEGALAQWPLEGRGHLAHSTQRGEPFGRECVGGEVEAQRQHGGRGGLRQQGLSRGGGGGGRGGGGRGGGGRGGGIGGGGIGGGDGGGGRGGVGRGGGGRGGGGGGGAGALAERLGEHDGVSVAQLVAAEL